MKFRYARHTNDLKSLIKFFTEVIGLKKFGGFENHSGYNGVFLGYPPLDWHLEFTESNAKVDHRPDEDDLIVFYFNSEEELNTIKKNIENSGIPLIKSKNSYWQKMELRSKTRMVTESF